MISHATGDFLVVASPFDIAFVEHHCSSAVTCAATASCTSKDAQSCSGLLVVRRYASTSASNFCRTSNASALPDTN